MAILLNDFVKEVLATPCFGFIGTVNESNQPLITRFFGYKSDDPLTTLTLYTFKKDSKRVTNQLSVGAKLTATLSNAMDYKTIQFKGTYQKHYDTPEEELINIRENNLKQAEIMAMFGISNDVFATWKYEPSVAINIEVQEIFDQTPKINAGNKIN